LRDILQKVSSYRVYTDLRKGLSDEVKFGKGLPQGVIGLCEGGMCATLALLCADYYESFGAPALIVCPDERQAERLAASLRACEIPCEFYPERDFNYHNITSSHEFEQRRIGILDGLMRGELRAVTATPAAILQRTVPPAVLDERSLTLKVGDEYPIDKLCEIVTLAGYVRSECADAPGLFSARGGIFDFYGAGMSAPVRAEFFGDEIDTLSAYDPMTQRRTDPVDSLCILPAREVVADEKGRKRVVTALNKLLDKADSAARDGIERELISTSEGMEMRFADRFINLVYDENTSILDYFDDRALVVCTDKNALDEQLKSYEWNISNTALGLIEEGLIDGKDAVYGVLKEKLFGRLYSRHGVVMSAFGNSFSGVELSGLYEFRSTQGVSYADKNDLLIEDLHSYINLGYTVDIMCESEASLNRVYDMLSEEGITATKTGAMGAVRLYATQPFSGFALPDAKYVCISLAQSDAIKARRQKRAKHAAKKSKSERILSYADLSVGDYVVHENHGIGIYTGIQTLTVDGAVKDFVKIKYDGKDVLYLPCDQLDMLSKYIGAHSEDGTLKLNKIGGTEWAKSKSRVKGAAKEMARELIALYAARTRLPGYAFAKDDEYQEEFEADFPYEETDGQTVASSEVKEDMEKGHPMDRLLCGDVGFGKTEVAMRAAFKAAMNNKQVAILVPTTILAMQHYQSFSARMRGFPVNIDVVCRFRTPKQQKETLKRVSEGKVDILIGTHRMLSKDINFRDLGLLIIDEEQRFGVAHKEKLKQLSTNVDVLTLTATPIPRTLNMAMSGIRDMSILEEAPGDRLPVQSYVLEYDDIIIADALRRELRRGGQVFYLCNNIERIDRVVAKLQAMVPDARIAGAHGRMDREELSDIWQGLLNGEIDILVSTTIIEAGIDVPGANTLIIENADRFGLSQLHQIRGRVGRSSRRAYAYFTYPKGKALTEIATRRLGAIREYTEFGSGFRIALRDLEIRGAGNVLGAEQHGHMESVGYDLYMKLLNEAILEEKGQSVAPVFECTVSYGKSAYIPESYIKAAGQRIAAYRRISEIRTDEDMQDVLDELIDRYGEPPVSVQTLVNIALLRSYGSMCKIERIEYESTAFKLTQKPMNLPVWRELAKGSGDRLSVIVAANSYVKYKPEKAKNAIPELISVLKKYKEREENP